MPISSSESGTFDHQINIPLFDNKIYRNFSLRRRNKPKAASKNVETQAEPKSSLIIKNKSKAISNNVETQVDPNSSPPNVSDNCQDDSVYQDDSQIFKPNKSYQFSCNPAHDDDSDMDESLTMNSTTTSVTQLSSNGSMNSLGGQTSLTSLQSQIYKMHELYSTVAKERDELQKENASLKRELSYSKYMIDGYKNAFTRLEDEMINHLAVQEQQEEDSTSTIIDNKDTNDELNEELNLRSLPKAKENPSSKSLPQNTMSSTRSLNLKNRNVDDDDVSMCHTVISLPGRFQVWNIRKQKQRDTTDVDDDDVSMCHTVMSLPGRFQGWNIRQQKQQDNTIKEIDVDITRNEIDVDITRNKVTNDSNDKRTEKRVPLFSRFKPGRRQQDNGSSSENVKMNHDQEQSSNYSVSDSVMPDLTVIMEDVILDNYDEDKIDKLENKINELEEIIDQKQPHWRNSWRRRSSA